jgi:AraC-like DNA-binding protein
MIEFNLRSSLLLVAMVQGLVIAILLIIRRYKSNRIQDFFLAGLLFYLVSSLIEHFIGFMGVYDKMREAGHDLTYFPFDNPLMFGPLIFWYVRSLTDSQFKWQKKELVHLLLPFLYYIFHFYVWLLPDKTKFALISNNLVFWTLPDVIYYGTVLWYLWRSLLRYRNYRQLIEQEYSNTGKMTLDWLKIFLYSFTGYIIYDIVFSISAAIGDFGYTGWYWLNLSRAILLYYISVTGWAFAQKSQVDFHVIEQREVAILEQKAIVSSNSIENSLENEPISKLLFTPEDLEIRARQLDDFMKEKKPWLDPELTLSSLSGQVKLNTSQLSYLINNGFDKNFNDYVNQYRVNAVKQKMKTAEFQHLSLLGIAFESGFNSKATFNRAFKKLTGLAPSEFGKEVIN